MSFVVFALVIAFILWQRLGKSRRPARALQAEAGGPASPLLDLAGDAQGEAIRADIAGLVSKFLGQNGQELIGQAVSRAIQESTVGTGVGLGSAGAMEPIRKTVAPTRTASPARDKRRAKYLLDCDAGHRQRTDRTARLQQSFRGKGLCSPR
ncbi:hypothetical protein FJ938_09810 [Mesorhizobium sp. B2-4-14]|uniref:hypothetical protein n=1 Tax=Mesorhizobium sp. B2-4-14 TaxID=2589935 RepID=UPI00112D323B|nr:hypothetical protein [Mesorhizobium sp. B2-4-14]TPL07890.1 hypothetical protein FJ938_09810 [Mesorhizobium sp. B2-4-14]